MTDNLPATTTATTIAEPITTDGSPAQTLMQKGVENLRAHAEMLAAANQFAEVITQTGMCPEIYRGKPLEATAAILRGAALGFSPNGALEAFFVIKGKTGMYARAMIAVAENVGCHVWEDENSTDQCVTWHGVKPGTDIVQTVTWDMDRAQKAGYASNNRYKTNPMEMLRAKCQAELARIIAPGALMGLYSEVEQDAFTAPTTMARTQQAQVQAPASGVDALKQALGQPPSLEGTTDFEGRIRAATSRDQLETIMQEVDSSDTDAYTVSNLRDLANQQWEQLTN